MSIGYASKTLAVPGAAMRSITQRLATPERLAAVIADNLAALEVALAYNARNRINLFRISSDVIPFGSSPVNTLDWAADFAPQLAALGRTARTHGMRLSMHPGQYTVLNSPNADVVERAVADLVYHAAFLDALELDATAKIVLHVGGVYGDKEAALDRFARAYETLPATVRRRLVIENDDRLFTARDVLALSRRTGAPVGFATSSTTNPTAPVGSSCSTKRTLHGTRRTVLRKYTTRNRRRDAGRAAMRTPSASTPSSRSTRNSSRFAARRAKATATLHSPISCWK